MKKSLSILSILLLIFSNMAPAFAAHVINKEDAALFKKDSIYSDVTAGEQFKADNNSGGEGASGGSSYMSDEVVNKFSVVTATKNGSVYTNPWSNYKIDFSKYDFMTANDVYDFNAEGMKFDFGIYFKDYSRIAVYYTRLARDINVVCANFAPNSEVTEVMIAGEVFKHVSLDVPYPYGVEKYEYYLRNIEGKLMVIELYYEDGREISKEYIDKFERLKE